ncbi:MAG: hypothetical protein ACKOW9_02615 [Candidatus Paceibacterota bacterium]
MSTEPLTHAATIDGFTERSTPLSLLKNPIKKAVEFLYKISESRLQRKGLPVRVMNADIPVPDIWDKSTELELIWNELKYKRVRFYENRRKKATKLFFSFSLLNFTLLYASVTGLLEKSTLLSSAQLFTAFLVLYTLPRTDLTLKKNKFITDPDHFIKRRSPELAKKYNLLTGRPPLPPYDNHWLIPNKGYTEDTAKEALAGFLALDGFERTPSSWVNKDNAENIRSWEELGYLYWLENQNLTKEEREIFESLQPSYQGTLSELIKVAKSI